MPNTEFSDAAVVLVGHGSTLNADSSRPTFQHADSLRALGLFGQVTTCFWKEEPAICGVLRNTWQPRIFIVPLFISDGYFTEQVIPRELGLCENGQKTFARIQRQSGRELHYCQPVGTHPSMTPVLLDRARSIVQSHPLPSNQCPPFHEMALVIAGHGTGNNENSRKAIENQVERIRKRGEFAEVLPAFMEEEPRIETIYSQVQSEHIVMVPFFISDGLHSYEDIPVMLGEDAATVRARFVAGQPTWTNPTPKNGKWVWYSRSIGDERGIVDVILERIRESAAAAV